MNNYLLDAVDKLTLNHITKVAQTNEAGISCISEVDHPPLLLQLRDAVAGGTGSHTPSSAGNERIPVNPGALEMFDAIAKRINAWYITVPNAREDRYIHERLRDWYVDYTNQLRAGKISDADEYTTVKLIEGWARNIEGLFDPPITLELTEEHWEPVLIPKTRVRVIDGEKVQEPVLDINNNPVMKQKISRGKPLQRLVKTEPAACPLCSERFAFDPKTGDKITALILEYRNLGIDTLDRATGLCRSCEMVWRGRTALRELRFDLGSDHPETAA